MHNMYQSVRFYDHKMHVYNKEKFTTYIMLKTSFSLPMWVISIIQNGHNLFIIMNKIMAQQIKYQIGLGENMTFTQKKLVRTCSFIIEMLFILGLMSSHSF